MNKCRAPNTLPSVPTRDCPHCQEYNIPELKEPLDIAEALGVKEVRLGACWGSRQLESFTLVDGVLYLFAYDVNEE